MYQVNPEQGEVVIYEAGNRQQVPAVHSVCLSRESQRGTRCPRGVRETAQGQLLYACDTCCKSDMSYAESSEEFEVFRKVKGNFVGKITTWQPSGGCVRVSSGSWGREGLPGWGTRQAGWCWGADRTGPPCHLSTVVLSKDE